MQLVEFGIAAEAAVFIEGRQTDILDLDVVLREELAQALVIEDDAAFGLGQIIVQHRIVVALLLQLIIQTVGHGVVVEVIEIARKAAQRLDPFVLFNGQLFLQLLGKLQLQLFAGAEHQLVVGDLALGDLVGAGQHLVGRQDGARGFHAEVEVVVVEVIGVFRGVDLTVADLHGGGAGGTAEDAQGDQQGQCQHKCFLDHRSPSRDDILNLPYSIP